jgi:vacuolar-type H+-ATPase subunit C/Vma6
VTVGYDYLSARARGFLGRLLPAERLRALCGLQSVEDLLHELALAPAYAADVAAVAGVQPPLDALGRALERHRMRVVQTLRAAATGAARVLIDLVLGRDDLVAVKAVLRRWRARDAGHPVTWPLPVPGTLDASTLQALASASSVAALADLLALTGPAGAALARVLRTVPSARPAALEDRLDRAWAADAVARCGEGPDAEVVRTVLGWEIDVRNLLAALRAGGEPLQFLPGGRFLRDELLHAIAATDDRAAAAAWLAATPYAGVLDGDGRLPWRQVERRLERRVLELHRRLMFASDPLGMAPVSFCLAATQAEVRDLRTIAAGLAVGLLPSVMAEALVGA